MFVSSNPAVDPALMPAWTGRIDLLFRQGLLYVVAYKRYPPDVGFLHDAQWFEDDVRRTWQRS